MIFTMRAQSGLLLAASAAMLICCHVRVYAADETGDTFVAVFDFVSQSTDGASLADAVRLKLSRTGEPWQVLDTQSMKTLGVATPKPDASAAALRNLLENQAGAHVCI